MRGGFKHYEALLDIADPSQWVARMKRKAVERLLWQRAELRLSVESGQDPARWRPTLIQEERMRESNAL
ncbi:MAG: hypothetical protein JO307_21830 [Bryobacterales bacterium]|nr:hypothetical protein [Bryobacterales bacterium]